MPARIGVDVGGTFTDLIYLDERTGAVRAGKGPSRPAAVDEGVRAVVTATLSPEEIAGAEYFLHGTTVGLNALLERAGARVGAAHHGGIPRRPRGAAPPANRRAGAPALGRPVPRARTTRSAPPAARGRRADDDHR